MITINRIAIGALLVLVMILSGCSTPPVEESEKRRHIDFSKETPSAQIAFKSKSIRLLLGGGWGSGAMTYKGKEYKVKVKKLSAGGVGYKEVDAVGDVYFLEKPEDIEGSYAAGTIGATAYKGVYAGTYENRKGVILALKGKSTGLALSLGISKITIDLVE
ncbi:MAG: hypothetical protein GY792_32100 [Gammaproteobacteria bacterium]|nr:hypothetical protein [Gammaproteobacteria bacterium]